MACGTCKREMIKLIIEKLREAEENFVDVGQGYHSIFGDIEAIISDIEE